MPDAVAPEIQFKPAETLHFGAETTVAGLSPEMQAAKARAAELRKERSNKPNDGKSFLESFKNKPSEKKFTQQNRNDLDLKFGVGETTSKPDGSIDKFPTTPEAKALWDEAQGEIKNINKYMQYSEITAEAAKTGKSVVTILNERLTNNIEGPKDQAEFDKQREEVLDFIINAEVIQQGLPELATIANPADRRKLIEETLAKDPALKAKVLGKMVDIAERAKNLPELQVSKDVSDADASKKKAETKSKASLDSIGKQLDAIGVQSADIDVLKIEIDDLMKTGKSVDQVMSYLKPKFINVASLPNLASIREFHAALASSQKLKTQKEALESRGATQQQIANTQRELDKQSTTVANFETRMNADPILKAEADKFVELSLIFSNQKDSNLGTFNSPFARELDEIRKAHIDISAADKTLQDKQADTDKAKQAWRVNRLVQESNLISEMKNIIPDSIVEVLSDRHTEMENLEKQKMGKAATEQEAQGKKAVADGIRKVEEVKSKRWIEYDPTTRERKVNRKAIGDDIKYAAYGGEDAIKRLILRDSGLDLTNAVDTTGAVVTGVDPWKEVDLDKLPEDIRSTLNGVYEAQKDSYKQKLFGDFFLGKSFYDKTIFGDSHGKLALKRHEYELLQRNFSEVFQGSINAKVEAKAAVEKLKKSGVEMNGGLLALLALLFGAPFVAGKKMLGMEE